MTRRRKALVDELDLDRAAPDVAPGLVGCELVRETPEGRVRARIVETEAYTEEDPASHSHAGETPRSRAMFGEPGHWYIYRCYGIHWMINVVCSRPGCGEAVLIRAAEPLEGVGLMEERRGLEGPELTNGPGKLAEALRVDDALYGESISPEPGSENRFYLTPGREPAVLYESPRVGLSRARDRRWRFFCESPYCSDVDQNELRRRRN